MAVNLGAQGISIPGLYPGRGKPRKIGQAESFIMSALAPSGAVVFTNPFDTAKVRMQLQGQSQRKYGAQAPILYKNSADAIRKIYVNEGIRGLQKGLTPAILREGSKNFFRIGMYDPIMNMIHDPKDGRAPGWKRVIAGSLSGMMGAVSCNPFELVKTRLQSAAAGKLAVGHQYGYTGVTSALVSIYKQDGLSGLYRGSFLSMGRSFVGSGANLSSFSLMKEYLTTEFHWEDDIWLDMVCGLGSGVVSWYSSLT
ncbi:hypothetical protein HK103_006181 [Boothiomyces macroporosus]|uniref:Uncharacterized protein n=1 Tax=Boothiomyces macroporosus TaxID=261099 RepID=A0AAD5UEF1_9FUNG|nr:hypothetical protein HK103_006181 [Boothiomyces macroporosus]